MNATAVPTTDEIVMMSPAALMLGGLWGRS
jgi:hypothetical protein